MARPDVAGEPRAGRAEAEARRRLRHRVDAALPGPPGPGRRPRQRHPPARPPRGLARGARRRDPRARRGAGHLRRQPRQPCRHGAVAVGPAGAGPSQDRGGRRRRPLLRPALEGAPVGLRPGGRPHRTPPCQPQVSRGHRRAACATGGTSSSSPRGAGPPTVGSRPCAGVPPTWPRARADRWCRCTSTAPTGSGPGAATRLRRSPTRITFGSPHHRRRGRGRPPARGEDRRRAGHPGRRGADRLVDGTPARRVGADPVSAGPRGVAVAAGLGARPRPPPRRRGRRRPLGAASTTESGTGAPPGARARRRRRRSAASQPHQARMRRTASAPSPAPACQPRAPTASRRSARKARSSTSSRGAGTDPVAHASSRSARAGLRARAGPCA